MLVVSLICPCAPGAEIRLIVSRVGRVLRNESGVVVLGLVIVPRHNPRKRRVGGLQVWIGSVLRVSDAVILDGCDLVSRQVGPLNGARSRRPLVDVVTEVNGKVDALLR